MVETSDKRAGPGGRFGYPIIIAAIVGIGALLVVQSSFSSGTYSMEIDAIQSQASRYMGRDMKIVGKVSEGSIETHHVAGRIETTFQIHDGKGHTLPVLYPHNPPDPFKEGRQVIVEGTLDKGEDGKHRVTCHKLTVKCPSKYQEEGLADANNSDDYFRQKYGGPAAGGTAK